MRKFLTCLFLIILFGKKLFSASEISENSIIFGVLGGKTDVAGLYKDQLREGYSIGFYVNYSLFKNRFLLFESDLSYTQLSLQDSASSSFYYYSLGIGPVIYMPFWRFFKPYAGLMANINYFELTAVKTNRKEQIFKPGVMVKSGFYIPIYNDISINLGLKYSINELSRKIFQNITYFAGASYSYNFFPREKIVETTRQIETDEYYESGLKHFKIGDGLKAKEYFDKVILYDKKYKDVENYLKIIKINEENYKNALKLIAENKPFDALPLLIDAGKYLIEALEKLYEIRSLLAKEENNLAELGIDAYNKEDYERCIYFMKKVELINPDNEYIKIYLPRAIKRYDALKKFE